MPAKSQPFQEDAVNSSFFDLFSYSVLITITLYILIGFYVVKGRLRFYCIIKVLKAKKEKSQDRGSKIGYLVLIAICLIFRLLII